MHVAISVAGTAELLSGNTASANYTPPMSGETSRDQKNPTRSRNFLLNFHTYDLWDFQLKLFGFSTGFLAAAIYILWYIF